MSTTAVSSAAVQKQLKQGKVKKGIFSVIRHLVLALLAFIWLVPIAWLLLTSFSTDKGINFTRFVPESFTMWNYVSIMTQPDSVAQFPRWFMNTLVVACFNCVISTCFVLMVAYAISCCRFKGRKLLQNLSVTVNLFPGVLAMIAVYFVLKYMNLTNSYAGLIMVYAGSSGLGYLICKGFFDTVPVALREAAKLDGASEARIFFQIVIPMSRPILVYTIISSFLTPWTDFVVAKMILNSGVSTDWTVASACTTCCKRLWSTATSPVSAQAVFWWLSPSPSCLSSCRSSMLRALPPVQQRAKPLHQRHMAQ